MRATLYKLGGRKFIAYVTSVASTCIAWGFHKLEPYDAVLAILGATAAYLTANVVDGAVDVAATKKETPCE